VTTKADTGGGAGAGAEAAPLRIGISTCLLGENVRYDGGHKRNRFLVDTLGQYCEFVPVCPEVEVGMGTPREPIRLAGDPEEPRLVAPGSGRDWTDEMSRYSRQRVRELGREELDGYVLKKDSPSCGLFRVKVWHEGGGGSERKGRGLFAEALVNGQPLLPIEEEGRLHDATVRENFIERLFGYRRWREFRTSRPRARGLVAFHTNQKLTLLSHSPKIYREMGQLVAEAGTLPMREILPVYAELYMKALSLTATRRKHTNVLQHLAGFLKRDIDQEDRAELKACIDEYRLGRVPLVVPLTLIRHHFRRHPHDWVEGQTYLDPYPAELMLRNHV